MATLMPYDDNGHPIPALRLRAGGAHAIGVTDVSARNAVAFAPDTRVIGLYATGPVFLRQGDGAVSAGPGDHFLPAGVCCDLSLGDARQGRFTHVAAVRAGTDCTLYVSEKE